MSELLFLVPWISEEITKQSSKLVGNTGSEIFVNTCISVKVVCHSHREFLQK